MPVKKFDLSTWDGFSDLPKEGLDFLLDVTALNKKMADRKDNPYRWRTAGFRAPKGLTGNELRLHCNRAVDKWLMAFSKQGWDLASKIQIFQSQRPFALDLYSGVPMLDYKEMNVRAIFKMKKEPTPLRIEVPAGTVRRHPDQKISLQEAMKVEGVKAVPRRKRPQNN